MLVAAAHFFGLVAHEAIDDALVDAEGGKNTGSSSRGLKCDSLSDRRDGLTRARVTQILMLLRLAPEIQERIFSMPKSVNPPRISELALLPIAVFDDKHQQLQAFADIVSR